MLRQVVYKVNMKIQNIFELFFGVPIDNMAILGVTYITLSKRGMGRHNMAKTKAGQKKMGRPKLPGGPANREVLVGLRGSKAYGEWLDGLNRETSIPKAAIVRLALKMWAESRGLPSPPEV